LNLRTNDNHPCEVLGDLAHVRAQRGSWDGLRVAMVGPTGNIAQSWLEAAAQLPIEVIQVAPKNFQYHEQGSGSRCSMTDDPAAIEAADLIVTDCWPANVTETQKADFAALRIDPALLDRCQPGVLFVPCPPVTRGNEVSVDAMVHPRCLAKPAKAYLLHAQNAVLEYVI
jgi:ornithine carbamoyltransferase